MVVAVLTEILTWDVPVLKIILDSLEGVAPELRTHGLVEYFAFRDVTSDVGESLEGLVLEVLMKVKDILTSGNEDV